MAFQWKALPKVSNHDGLLRHGRRRRPLVGTRLTAVFLADRQMSLDGPADLQMYPLVEETS